MYVVKHRGKILCQIVQVQKVIHEWVVRGGYSCLGKDENSVESAEMMNCDKEYVEKMECMS